MAEINVYSANSKSMAPVNKRTVGEAEQGLPQEVGLTDDLAREQAQWRATKLTFIIILLILGAEQVIPLSDALRSQIGVLTVLLAFGFWNLLCGMIRPSGNKR